VRPFRKRGKNSQPQKGAESTKKKNCRNSETEPYFALFVLLCGKNEFS
jgi:hypothetical protein